MKPMLPVLADSAPLGREWKYEVKYDGFRAVASIDMNGKIRLMSRNGRSLLPLFPEIKEFLQDNMEILKTYVPLVLDGELVLLENAYKANFAAIQTRGRLRNELEIIRKIRQAPCRLLVFDALKIQGRDLKKEPYSTRKKELASFFKAVNFPSAPDPKSPYLLQMIPAADSLEELWEKIILYDGEGIVAKHINSQWKEGKRTEFWVKHKNWKYVSCFITGYDKSNGYFTIAVYKGKNIHPVGQFLFGISPEEKQALIHVIRKNKLAEDEKYVKITPVLCVEIKYLEVYEEQLREPHFSRFRFDLNAEDCTYDKFRQNQKNFPESVEISHPEKPLWENPPVKKIDYIHYLREISPYILPFLKNRLLTVIRYPHGIFGEAFYQKNCPEYAPDYVDRVMDDGINYIICNNLQTLLWLGNQLAFEFHVPFQTINSKGPAEIVFDLDPPSRKDLPLAVKAARLIKEVLDHVGLISFIKTSGNKGLQIYIPLPENQYSFEDTRLFTSFITDYLISTDPDSFTAERMKKKRGNRLYIDYVQHAPGKTIIAPYSPRGNGLAAVAAPLFWEEVNEDLKIENFRITNMIKRIKENGDPFHNYFQVKEQQNFAPILEFLKNKN